MSLIQPSWQLSVALCCGLALLALALGWTGRAPVLRSFAREFAVIEFLHGMWVFVGRRVRTHSAGAMERAEQVRHLQDRLHFPDELALQQAFLGHPVLIQAMNVYYESLHLTGMFAFLLWVWWRRRDSFRGVRNVVAVCTALYLALQAIPVAPPRLLAGSGYVDTALYYGQSVYGGYTTGLASQLTAMPSVHVGWAFLVAWYVARLGRGPLRWIGAVHFLLTVLVVVVTANHWWLDGVVAVLIAVPVLVVQSWLRPRGELTPSRQPAGADPVPVLSEPVAPAAGFGI